MSDNEVAPLETAFGVDHHVSRAEAPERPVQDGGPEMVQLLNPEGERVPHPEHDAVVDALTDEELRGFYRDLVLIRRFDAEATALQRQGELGLWASLLGQEAAQVGSGRALRPQDYAFPTYREHGVAWCRGVDPVNLLGMFRGVNHGGWDPNEKNFHLYTIIIGAQTLHATGYAMGVQRDGSVGTGDDDRDTAVIAYFGDGATSQGDVSEALVFAGVNNSPVVFFCQNNQWAISEPNEKQTRAPLWHRARGFGFPGIRVDGNDVLAVYAVTKAALDAARSGQGPTFIEAYTYRMGAHTTSDDPSKYRVSAEVEVWKHRDPIERFKRWLTTTGRADTDFFDAVEEESDELGTSVRERCLALPDPPGTDMFDHVYAEPHPAHRPRAGGVRALPGVVRGGPLMAATTLAKGITSGLRAAMEKDPKVVLMGEDIGKLGGVFRVTEGLQKDFGEDRVIDTPLAEAGILGTAIGMALRGYRPVVEIQFDGFVYPAFDHIVSQVAKLRARSLGHVAMPIVIRIPFGGGIGAVEHHSESNEAYFAHTAGLRVVACSNPHDAHWMIQQAIETDDPVVFYEPKRRYWDKGEVGDGPGGCPRHRPRAARGHRRHPARLRPDGEDLPPGGPGRRGGGPQPRGRRPALALAARRGGHPRLGAQDRPGRRRARGLDVPRHGRRDLGAGHRAGVLPPRGAGAAGRRLQRALPAEPDRGGVPPRPRPCARRRRPLARSLKGVLADGSS